jgi:hypothetical protein
MRTRLSRLGSALAAPLFMLACDAGASEDPGSRYQLCVAPLDGSGPPVCSEHTGSKPFDRTGYLEVAIESTFTSNSPSETPIVSFDMALLDEGGEVAHRVPALRSDLFGNPETGDVSYIVACDANAPVLALDFHVAAVFDRTADGSTQPTDRWEAACVSDCRQTVRCVENEDTSVNVVFAFTSR